MKAIWKGQVIAESNNTVSVEGNAYFPPESIHQEFFADSSTRSVCPWKGTASYYDVVVDGEKNPSAAWYYPETKEAANEIKGHIAFWRGIEVVE